MVEIHIQATVSQQGFYTETDKELVQSFDSLFKGIGVDVKHQISETVTKSTDPLYLTIAVSLLTTVVTFSGQQLYIDYIHKPLESKIKNVAIGWKDMATKRPIHKPMYFRLEVDGIMTISTYPYLFNKDWIENFPQKLLEILNMIKSNSALKCASQIRIVSTSIDEIHIVVWCEKSRPEFVIDLSNMTLNALEEDYIQEIADTGVLSTVQNFGQDATKDDVMGIALLANDNYVEEWTKSQLLKSKLHKEIIQRINDIRE